ncbi:MAG TPA: undecaprenyldiphospho-muramoylpentapeptide beta-N-acetylglucosaminyltransferase [Rhodospirillaceae bacterium]|nr:MAG: undecaprenyldiphospho-muramoylpentapeptide beta-N-acetylglucosaminyltransferase [Alphaproteobacteria bacterium GWF2_58_20]HAU30002.1 undecaprenyldiphospho-muramoylpentapeptide beta-N-acetylglucosaminyltransferase [Rhodospirillaceae bacterium]
MTQCIILAAGGTGGHLFPASALAREILARGLSVVLATDSRGANYQNLPDGMDITIVTRQNTTGGVATRLKALAGMTIDTIHAIRMLRRLRPALIVGFGGYPSMPTIAAAILTRTPFILQEQNAILGRTNRVFARWAKLIATAFPHVGKMPRGIPTLRVGNPVREAILAAAKIPYAPSQGNEPFHLFVTGGSQGARIFGQVVPEALALMPEAQRLRIRLTLQCRNDDMEIIKARLAELGVHAETAPFFSDMPERITSCQLAIARAGASTISELAVIGRPALLVPYPFAMDDHQTANAHSLVEAGGGWHISNGNFTTKAVADFLTDAMTNPQKLATAAASAKAWAMPDASAKLCETVLSLLPGKEPLS